MKTVYPTDQVFHQWANGKASTQRLSNGKHGNVSADSNCIYSYAECIGIITPSLTLLSSCRWSATTNKHQSLARRAVNHHSKIVTLNCPFPSSGNLPQLVDIAAKTAAATLKNIDYGNKARIINQRIAAQYADYQQLQVFAHSQAPSTYPAPTIVDNLQDLRALRDGLLRQDLTQQLNLACGKLMNRLTAARNVIKQELHNSALDSAITDMRRMPESVANLVEQHLTHNVDTPTAIHSLPAHAAKLLPALDKLHAARAAELLTTNTAKCDKWRAGEQYIQLPHGLPPMLRLYRSTCADDAGDQIQTSWGATVPATVAAPLWQLIQQARATGQDIDTTVEVGDFMLTRVHADGAITVGCHKITYSELARIAIELGYITT